MIIPNDLLSDFETAVVWRNTEQRVKTIEGADWYGIVRGFYHNKHMHHIGVVVESDCSGSTGSVHVYPIKQVMALP